MTETIYKPRPLAGLNVDRHRLAIDDPSGALLSLGVRYMGENKWRLPPGASIECLGYDEEDKSFDWKLTIMDEYTGPQTYYVWTDDNNSGQ